MKIPISLDGLGPWVHMRAARDSMLAASDWTQLTDAPVDHAAWAAYRQALRDAPQTYDGGAEWDAPDPPA